MHLVMEAEDRLAHNQDEREHRNRELYSRSLEKIQEEKSPNKLDEQHITFYDQIETRELVILCCLERL